jgi:hypothetical protein
MQPIMNDLMNIIDDVKDSIGDGKYLELCNAMKKIHMSNERPATPTITPAFVVFSTMALKEQFTGRFRYKRDRKITLNYGTTQHTYVPHSVFVNDKLARWRTADEDEDEDECSYYIDAGANIQIVLTFDMDIKKNERAYCNLSVTYYGNPILSYEVNELTIKRNISTIYN